MSLPVACQRILWISTWIWIGLGQTVAFELAQATPNLPIETPAPASQFEYQRLLREYNAARQSFEQLADQYWSQISEKRALRNKKRREAQLITLEDYVLTQPPVYSGPAKPRDPSGEEPVPPQRKYVPVVADFIAASRKHFNFMPQLPKDEMEYKRAYARRAAAAGLTKDQVVRIYAFESSGNGKYDVQAGLEYARPDARAITTALGYNQLLSANSVSLMAGHGTQFLNELKKTASTLGGDQKQALERKIAIVKQMIDFCKTVPDRWDRHVQLASTPQGLAVHAMVLDVDVGPLLQVQKLVNSIKFARAKKYTRPLTAAELEMMNLTGDGNGFDLVTMPTALREKVPTSNFFQPSGYASNRVARTNNVVSALLTATDRKMDEETKLAGAAEMAAAFAGN